MPATLELQVNEITKNTTSVLTVKSRDEGFNLKQQGIIYEITKGKYAGFRGIALGKNPSNSSIYSTFEVLFPKLIGPKFKVTIIEREYESYNYNNNYFTMICRTK